MPERPRALADLKFSKALAKRLATATLADRDSAVRVRSPSPRWPVNPYQSVHSRPTSSPVCSKPNGTSRLTSRRFATICYSKGNIHRIRYCTARVSDRPGYYYVGGINRGGKVFRRALFVLAILGVVGVGVATIAWLGWHSDARLARWSSIAGVVSAGLSALALAVAIVPMWSRRDEGARPVDRDGETAQTSPPRINVVQNVKHNHGPIQGEGVQHNFFGGKKR